MKQNEANYYYKGREKGRKPTGKIDYETVFTWKVGYSISHRSPKEKYQYVTFEGSFSDLIDNIPTVIKKEKKTYHIRSLNKVS